MLDLAKTQYGHFAVLKAITYCDEDQDKHAISSSLSGHFVSLGIDIYIYIYIYIYIALHIGMNDAYSFLLQL